MREADVRLGIVSYNTAALLERCLAALPAALAGLEAEVVVVDNASSDGSAEVAGRADGVKVARNVDNVGYPRAMNQALRDTSARVLIALNPDTEPPPGSLARLVERLDAEPRTALVSPLLVNEDGSVQHSVHRFPSTRLALVMGFVPHRLRRGPIGRRYWLEDFADLSQPARVDWTVGAVHAIRRSAVADPDRPYPERWFMYAEDLGLCWDLQHRGWDVVFDPAVRIVHTGNAAGAAAFGEGRTARVLDVEYEWYRSTHGAAATRAWVGASIAGLGLKLAAVEALRRDDAAEQVRVPLSIRRRQWRGAVETQVEPVDRDAAMLEAFAMAVASRARLERLVRSDGNATSAEALALAPIDARGDIPAAVPAGPAPDGAGKAVALVRYESASAVTSWPDLGDVSVVVASAPADASPETFAAAVRAAGGRVDLAGRVAGPDSDVATVAVYDEPVDLGAPPGAFRVVALMPAYNEGDIIVDTLRDLTDQGVEVHVIDNWSNDGTYEYASAFGTGVTVERFPESGPTGTYDWSAILGRCEEVAEATKADWFILHDVDERRSPPWPATLREGFWRVQQAGYTAVNHAIVEFHPTDDRFHPGDPLEPSFEYYSPPRIGANRCQVKAWKASTAVDLRTAGGHLAAIADRRIFPLDFLLKHYPIRSQAHGEKKVLVDRRPRFVAAERKKRWHRHYDHVRAGHDFLRRSDDIVRFDAATDAADHMLERIGGLDPPSDDGPPALMSTVGVWADRLHVGAALRASRRWYRIARRRDAETGM